jgi:hypothetical protein
VEEKERETEQGQDRTSRISIRVSVPFARKSNKAVGRQNSIYTECKRPGENVKNTLKSDRLRDQMCPSKYKLQEKKK